MRTQKITVIAAHRRQCQRHLPQMILEVIGADRENRAAAGDDPPCAGQGFELKAFDVELDERGCYVLQTAIELDALHRSGATAHRGEIRAGGIELHGPAAGSNGLWKGAD